MDPNSLTRTGLLVSVGLLASLALGATGVAPLDDAGAPGEASVQTDCDFTRLYGQVVDSVVSVRTGRVAGRGSSTGPPPTGPSS